MNHDTIASNWSEIFNQVPINKHILQMKEWNKRNVIRCQTLRWIMTPYIAWNWSENHNEAPINEHVSSE